MFLKPGLFLLVFLLIAPASRAYLGAHLASAAEWINVWAPFSYILLLMLPIAGLASMYIVKKWPERVEPESPMAKYRKEIPFEED
jgi:hypothetical protein